MPLTRVHGLHRSERSYYPCCPIPKVQGELDLTYIEGLTMTKWKWSGWEFLWAPSIETSRLDADGAC